MAYEDCLANVLEVVLARDLPDEVIGYALADEAHLLAVETDDRD